jgi:AraC family transcriptional regulator of adaptative response/methylated-DNA-[protein]-cysteine methyltransferase
MDLWLSPHDARVRSIKNGGELSYGFGQSPFGDCAALWSGSSLLSLRFTENREESLEAMQAEWPTTSLKPEAESELLLKSVWEHPEEAPVMAIGTPFQLTVWESLRRSAAASTMTYGEVARSIGRPGAARAVGQAVGANPLAVVIPCHRVVSRGKLTGYRWGLDRKRALLAWELLRRDPLEMPF